MRRTARWLSPVNALNARGVRKEKANPDAVFDRLVAKAEEDVGYDSSREREFIESYRYLTHLFSQVEELSYIGWRGTLDDLGRRVTNHLRVQKLHSEHPEIAREPIERPVFVVGLPRTATTLAHKIFTRSEGNRAPLMWELMFTDHGGIDAKTRRDRIKATQTMATMAGKTSPLWDLIHPMDAEQPEECVFALPHNHGFCTRARLPEYRQWLAQHDFTGDYEHLKRVLQVLQWRQPRKRWILKAPFHLFNLDVLMKVFDSANIVWTHRDPATVMGSWCSLVETGTAIHNRTWDNHAIGREWLELFSEAIRSARRVRASAPRGKFIDIGYHSLTADPHRQLPEIFRQLDMPWSATDNDNLADVLSAPGLRRKHEYHLERYGIDHTDVDEAFAGYAALGFAGQ
ncbi:sulfotransferase family protein [Haloglycomyces albus]|uniref:sulfotransferase family protein n=1 Tax=Haloglycomyces albus TaxID=526067 RepID=UPI000A06F8F6|nr:sulfotransferase [Haloglycomyces albus]